MRSARDNALRRLPIGAEAAAGGVHLRVWAPHSRRVEAVFEGSRPETVVLKPEEGGYHSGLAPGRGAGDLYRLRLDLGGAFPDPASRFQPDGPHGPSEVIDPAAFPWTDAGWKGLRLSGQVFYELHVGSLTSEGTWDAAAGRLPALADLGVTAVEVMPVAEVPGRFNWGYDGVGLYAPTRLYGRPDDFRRFVDRAHSLGIGVLLDVVYNHLGPDGNYLKSFSPDYFTDRYKTEWGEAINYDGPGSGPVREFVVSNAAYWISEFHCDGLRVDATQNVYDASKRHVLADLAVAARAAAAPREVLLIAENEPQLTKFVESPSRGGFGFDGLWNDDFHHTLNVALTGRREAYFQDYSGSPQEILSSLKRGYLYQGQWYSWQRKRRGTSTAGLPGQTFVNYLDNHDQIANSTAGSKRLAALSTPGRIRAATAALLLGPGTPLMFQGQEFGCRAPFHFFADHKPGLRELVFKGRRAHMSEFPSMAAPEGQAVIPDPSEGRTFEICRVGVPQGLGAAQWLALHRDLLALRREDRVIAAQRADRIDGAVLAAEALAVRFFGVAGDDRLLLLNFGPDLAVASAAEPLLAPQAEGTWKALWSSEDPRYGGDGTRPFDETCWRLSAHSARLLKSEGRRREGRDGDA